MSVKRMTIDEKTIAQFEVEIFARDCGYAIMGIERDRVSGDYWGQVFSYTGIGFRNDDERFAAVDIVRCSHCNEIQACWGQYGDPANEITICTVCHNNFEVEPF